MELLTVISFAILTVWEGKLTAKRFTGTHKIRERKKNPPPLGFFLLAIFYAYLESYDWKLIPLRRASSTKYGTQGEFSRSYNWTFSLLTEGYYSESSKKVPKSPLLNEGNIWKRIFHKSGLLGRFFLFG